MGLNRVALSLCAQYKMCSGDGSCYFTGESYRCHCYSFDTPDCTPPTPTTAPTPSVVSSATSSLFWDLIPLLILIFIYVFVLVEIYFVTRHATHRRHFNILFWPISMLYFLLENFHHPAK